MLELLRASGASVAGFAKVSSRPARCCRSQSSTFGLYFSAVKKRIDASRSVLAGVIGGSAREQPGQPRHQQTARSVPTSTCHFVFGAWQAIVAAPAAALLRQVNLTPLAVVAAAMAFPLFLGVGSTNHVAMVLVFVVCLGVAYGAMYGSEAAFMSELFPTETRYSGISVSAQFAGVVAGGFAPLIAAALLAAYGHYWPVSVYLIVLAAISFVTGVIAPETRRVALRRGAVPPHVEAGTMSRAG